MAKAYNHHQLTQKQQHTHYTNNSFLPLLCRSSIKDVKLHPSFKDQSSSSSSSSSSSFSSDPSSPKVSCIGQIKRNNKLLIPFSSSTTTPSAARTTGGQVKYTHLKKWLSGKNLNVNAPPTVSAAAYGGGGGRSCRGGEREMRDYVSSRRSRCSKINNDGVEVNIREMDPPLPVMKKVPPAVAPEGNLWRRRSGAVALKTLQIQNQIHLGNNVISDTNQPAPTV